MHLRSSLQPFFTDVCVCVYACECIECFLCSTGGGRWNMFFIVLLQRPTYIDLKHNAHPHKWEPISIYIQNVHIYNTYLQSSRMIKRMLRCLYVYVCGQLYMVSSTIEPYLLIFYKRFTFIMIKCTAEERMMRLEDDRKWHIFAYRGFNMIVSMFYYTWKRNIKNK